MAAAWIILSATRHTTAKSNCLNNFFPTNGSSIGSEGDTLCGIFPWVDVGVMGGIWLVLAIFYVSFPFEIHVLLTYRSLKTYLYVVLTSYGASQRRDHEKYDQLNNNDNIPMNKRSDPWDTRASTDIQPSYGGNNYGHLRQESMSDVLAQPHVQPNETFSNANYAYERGSYPPPLQTQRKLSKTEGSYNHSNA